MVVCFQVKTAAQGTGAVVGRITAEPVWQVLAGNQFAGVAHLLQIGSYHFCVSGVWAAYCLSVR
jgi:hypothetical protein